jgi:hypothetical protein
LLEKLLNHVQIITTQWLAVTKNPHESLWKLFSCGSGSFTKLRIDDGTITIWANNNNLNWNRSDPAHVYLPNGLVKKILWRQQCLSQFCYVHLSFELIFIVSRRWGNHTWRGRRNDDATLLPAKRFEPVVKR